jgi:hypothetical protein
MIEVSCEPTIDNRRSVVNGYFIMKHEKRHIVDNVDPFDQKGERLEYIRRLTGQTVKAFTQRFPGVGEDTIGKLCKNKVDSRGDTWNKIYRRLTPRARAWLAFGDGDPPSNDDLFPTSVVGGGSD